MLNSTAAAKKQMVATTPATTGLARPSSGSSAGGKGSDRVGGGGRGQEILVNGKFSEDARIFNDCWGIICLKELTSAGHSHHVTALADQVIHDSHHSELIPGLLRTETQLVL